MKKVLIVLVAFFGFISCSSDDSSPDPIVYPENIYEGSVELNSPLEIEQFGANNYSEITGSLTITDPDNEQHITNLSGLNSISIIGQGLNIVDNPHLENLNGLNNLFELHYLNIKNNQSLNSLQALNNVTSSELNVVIENNDDLGSLNGLENLTLLNYLKIDSNSSLQNLNGLNNLTQTDLEIKNNLLLSNLDGLSNLEYSYELVITANESLNNLCGLLNLDLESNVYYTVNDNAYNPTKQDLEEEECSL